MKIKKSLAALTATVSIMALATGCSSSGSSGVVDTQADKGLAVMGDTITYDPNHLVNDGQPIELGYWSWGDESTDPVISMLHEYEKIHPNVTFKISQVAWSDYWVKTPLSLKGNKNAPVLFNVHNSEDALLRPHAVRLDGASDWRIFHQVVLPMSRNSIAALAIFTFLWNWEDYLWPFLMITDDDKQLLSVGLKMFSRPVRHRLRRTVRRHLRDHHPGGHRLPGVPEAVHRRHRHRLRQVNPAGFGRIRTAPRSPTSPGEPRPHHSYHRE